MARSVKKGPYIDNSLVKKIEALNAENKKVVVKTWARRSTRRKGKAALRTLIY